MEWVQVVRALRGLAASCQPIHFVLAHDEAFVLIEQTGKLIVNEREATDRELAIAVECADGQQRGRVILRDSDLRDVRCTSSAAGSNTLRIVLGRGYPILTYAQA